MEFFVILLILIALPPLIIPNVSSVCAADGMEWWMPCNDTGPYSDGIYVQYSILVPILTVIILVMGVISLVYWRKRK